MPARSQTPTLNEPGRESVDTNEKAVARGRAAVHPEIETNRIAPNGAIPEASAVPARIRIPCSVGLMAHDEEANIGRLLAALITERPTVALVREVIVTASGCALRA